MRKQSAKLAAILVLAGLSAFAQKPLPPSPAEMVQHHVDFLTKRLGLSASQQQQATTIYTNALSGQKALHDQMRSAHQALEAAVAKGDNAAIDEAAGNIGNLTGQMTSAHAKADAQFFRTLTSDQQSRFSQLQSRGPGRGFGGRRFGGSGGPQE
jgi:Spy/CpxP family protein refolding chaperone